MSDVALDLSGIGVLLGGLPEVLKRRLETDWKAFVVPVAPAPVLRIEVARRDGSDPGTVFRPKLMRSELSPAGARFELPEGVAEVDAAGAARIELAPTRDATRYFALMNLLRACLAWHLPRRGAAMLHAAGLVVEGRAYLLVGSEGAGKSTWAANGERAGCRVLSDDIVLCDAAEDPVAALGSPFRSTHRADYGPGRWPLAAILFPRWGAPPAWVESSRLLARARVAANLPFVADGLERDPGVSSVVERLACDVACRELTFGPDPAFVDLLRDDG